MDNSKLVIRKIARSILVGWYERVEKRNETRRRSKRAKKPTGRRKKRKGSVCTRGYRRGVARQKQCEVSRSEARRVVASGGEARRGEARRGETRASELASERARGKGREEGKARRGSVGGAVRPWEAVVRPRGGAATTRRCTARARQTDWHWHRGSQRQWSPLVTETVSRISRVRVSRTCAPCIF